jgi:hypothetical protein
MVITIKEIGKIIKEMVMVFTDLIMVKFMRDSGK